MKRAASAAALLLFAIAISRSDCALARQEPSDAIKLQSTLVSVPVIVSDREGRYLSGLRLQDFKLYEDRIEQKISVFDAIEEPINVALWLDTSRSTSRVVDDIKNDAARFLKELRPQDRALVVTFDYDVHLISPLTSDRKALERAIDKCHVGEYVGTALRDAVDEVIRRHFKRVDGRKAIILLTDGKDAGSRVNEQDLLDEAAESGAMIYSVFFETGFDRPFRDDRMRRFPRWGRPDEPRFPERPQWGGKRRPRLEARNEDAQRFLTELSEASAGRFYSSKLADLKKTFNLIAEELRHQYRLGFYPENAKADGQRHALKVEVGRPNALVRSRRSYQAASAGT
jgi:VWFA-related protein